MKIVYPEEQVALLNFATAAAKKFFANPDIESYTTDSIDTAEWLALKWNSRCVCIIRKDNSVEPMLYEVSSLADGSIPKLTIVKQSDVKDAYEKGYADGDTRGYHRGRADGVRFSENAYSSPSDFYWNYEGI